MLIMEPDGRLDPHLWSRHSLLSACWTKLIRVLQGRAPLHPPRHSTQTTPFIVGIKEAADVELV